MAENKPSGIVYIEPNRLLFYSSSVNKVLFQDFPPDTVSDLDIVNKEKFSQILNFFIQNALQKVIYDITIVFSQQSTFEKVLVPTISKDVDALTSEFISLVPFEEVLSRVYKENKNTKAYAVNKTIYEHIADNFRKNGSSIVAVLPVSIILEKSPDLANKLDLPSIAAKVDSLKSYSMIESYINVETQDQKTASVKNKKRTYLLLGVFFVLLIIMLVFGYNTFFAKSSVSKKPIEQKIIEQVTPTTQPEITSELSPTIIPTVTQSVATKSSSL